jgi:hypothetical protein
MNDPNIEPTIVRRRDAAKAQRRLERDVFKTSRFLDFVGERELTTQVGHAVEEWPLVILKEVTDNGI